MPAANLQSYKVTTNELSSATKFNNLVQAVEDLLNGLDNANIDAAAAIAVSKLASGSNGQLLSTVSGTPTWSDPAALGVSIMERRTTTVDIQNSSSELTLYDGSAASGSTGWNIAANSMSTDKMLRLTMIGDFLHNNVAANTVTLRIKFGGTTFFAMATNLGNVVGAARVPWIMHVLVSNLGAANSQMILVDSQSGRSDANAPSSGIGQIFVPNNTAATAALFGPGGISTLGTIDTTSAQKLDVTAQWNAASANNSWRTRYVVLELV